VLLQQRLDLGNDIFTTDERAELGRQVIRQVIQRKQRRKRVRQIRRDQLTHVFGLREVFQPMCTEIAQAKLRRHLALQQLGARTRDQHLPAVPDGEQSRDAVDRRTKIIAVALVGASRVQRHPHAHVLDRGEIFRS
jgi:hypothetical protein